MELEISTDENGELRINGEALDGSPLVRQLIETVRQFERSLILEYMMEVAGNHSNSLRAKAIRQTARNIDGMDHVSRFMQELQKEGVDITAESDE